MATTGKDQEEEHNFIADDVNWRQVLETEKSAVINWHENWFLKREMNKRW